MLLSPLEIEPDAPWPVNVALILAGLLALALPTWLTQRGNHRRIATIEHQVMPNTGGSIADVVARIEKAQTVQGDRLDVLVGDVGGLHSEMRDLRADLTTARADITGIRTDTRHDRRDVAAVRQEAVAAQRSLDEHLRAVPELVARAVRDAESAHVADCPLRQRHTPGATPRLVHDDDEGEI